MDAHETESPERCMDADKTESPEQCMDALRESMLYLGIGRRGKAKVTPNNTRSLALPDFIS
jgi:hypothetical protein